MTEIVVLVKQVPDTWEPRGLDRRSGFVDRGAAQPVLDEINERAIEVANSLRANHGGTIYAVTMGPHSAESALRRALAMGCDEAIHVSDDCLAGADAILTARALAAAVATVNPDLVVAGNRSTDGAVGVVPALVADLLGLAYLGNLDEVTLTDTALSGLRAEEHVHLRVATSLPAVVSVTELSKEAVIPNFMGLMKAKKKPLTAYSLSDLGLDQANTRSQLVSAAKRESRRGAGETMPADEAAAARLVAGLTERGIL